MSLLFRCLRCPASQALIVSESQDDQTFRIMTHAADKHELSVGQNGWTEGEDYQTLGQSESFETSIRSATRTALWIALNPHAYDDPEAEILEALVACFTTNQIKDILMAQSVAEAIAL